VRILVLSDLYPPASLGGYEVAAREVVEALRGRGHDVWVLTTDAPGGGDATADPRLARALCTRPRSAPSALRVSEEARRQRDDLQTVERLLAEAKPDLVFVWNVGGVSHQVLARLMNGPWPTVVYVFGDWPLRKLRVPHDLDPWAAIFAPRAESPWRSATRAKLAAIARARGVATVAAPLRFDHLEYGSRFMMDLLHRGGFAAGGSERLIYYGLFGEYARAAAEPLAPRDPASRRLLFVGRLWEAKGLHTVVEALGLLRERGTAGVTLTIAGPDEHPDYTAGLRRRAEELGVATQVRWAGAVPREGLLGLYREHDALVFPSVYDEPFGIVQLEAMAAGCPVVGTGTGGSAEILEPDRNALLFRAGDASDLADRLALLLGDAPLRERLREGGRHTVNTRFLGTRMVDEIESHLTAIVGGAPV
jgi:glycosyltransferase involved in cell wall biosynthesis